MTDHVGVHGSAFSSIDDPNDPAWHGHAMVPVDRRPWVAVALVVLVTTALAFATWMTVVRDGATPNATPVPQRSTVAAAPAREPGVAVQVSEGDDAPAGVQQWVQRTPAAAIAQATKAASSAAGGSGWAPAAATVPAYENGSGLLDGDLAGIDPRLLRRLDQVAVGLGRPVQVLSGWRTHHEQGELYQRFLAGTGNLAAVPGTSAHESGRAADVYVGGVALASVDGVPELAAAAGLHFPVGGEAWHVEMIDGAAAT